MANLELIRGNATETKRILDYLRYKARGSVTEAEWSQLGSCSDYQAQIIAEVPPAPAPSPPPGPTPTALLGFWVTYNGHGMAADCYLGSTPEQAGWGVHWGIEVQAPAPGRVEAYSFPTPLNAPQRGDPEHLRRLEELWGDGWVCMAPQPTKGPQMGLLASQMMFVAVYWPDQPLRLSNGQHAVWCGFGHCRGDIRVGRVDTGGTICVSFDSGVRFENQGIQARAAHVHTIGGASPTLSPNGGVPGQLVAAALGWQVQPYSNFGPGPNEYLSGGFVAGKPRSQWAGHAIPPMPE